MKKEIILEQIKEMKERLTFLQDNVQNAASSFHEMPNTRSNEEVSNMVSKPRSFEEIELLRQSVGNYYTGRLTERRNEFARLQIINKNYTQTGNLSLPCDIADFDDLWESYLSLLDQYCDDVMDILAFSGENA
tara:strand:+ start:52 stop:450 length:399 start_codon:yes stop_codon:yes gene_type:complete